MTIRVDPILARKIVHPEDFKAFMEAIWEMRMEPAPGGVHLLQHVDYDRYHDAVRTARLCGMKRTGGTKLNGLDAHVFRFPHAMNQQAVLITYDGGGMALSDRAYGPKTKRSPANG